MRHFFNRPRPGHEVIADLSAVEKCCVTGNEIQINPEEIIESIFLTDRLIDSSYASDKSLRPRIFVTNCPVAASVAFRTPALSGGKAPIFPLNKSTNKRQWGIVLKSTSLPVRRFQYEESIGAFADLFVDFIADYARVQFLRASTR